MTKEITQDLRDMLIAPLIAAIVTPIIEGQDATADVLLLVECVVAGVLSTVVPPAYDDQTLPTFEVNIRRRLAMLRLEQAPLAGSA